MYVRQDVSVQMLLLLNVKNHVLQGISALKELGVLHLHLYYAHRVIIAQPHVQRQLYAPKVYFVHLEHLVFHNLLSLKIFTFTPALKFF